MDQVYLPIHEKHFRIRKSQISIGLWVDGIKPDRRRNVGSYDNLALNYEFEKTEIVGNDDIVQQVRRTVTTKRAGNVSFDAEQFDDIITDLSFASTRSVVTQAENAAKSKPLKNLVVGDLIPTGILHGTGVITVAGAGAPVFTANTHFHVKRHGVVEILALPEAYSPDVEAILTVTGPAIAISTTERAILKKNDTLAEIEIVNLEDEGDLIILPKVTLNIEGALAQGGSSNDKSSVSIVGVIQKDILEPADRRMGYVIRYPDELTIPPVPGEEEEGP